eukprot:673451-Rhodomonas_salina.2
MEKSVGLSLATCARWTCQPVSSALISATGPVVAATWSRLLWMRSALSVTRTCTCSSVNAAASCRGSLPRHLTLRISRQALESMPLRSLARISVKPCDTIPSAFRDRT